MAASTPDQFWTLLVESKLVEPAPLDKLRREYEGLPFPPGASAASSCEPLARWLVKRGAVSEWQAKRLLRGEKGPFFIGDYRLLDRFDTGRGGAVFRARHEPTGRLVGITALVNKFCQEPAVWSDILKRTKGAHEAADPVLTRTWALEKAGSQRFVLSEDVAGSPFSEELSRRGALPVAEAGEVVLAVARAVAELHRRGLVHGGISLDTVRREPAPVGAAEKEGPVRLLQFPLVADPHVVPPRVVLDDAEAVARLGTRAAFLAPESLRTGRISDAAGDVYALGCLFHSLLSGAPPGWQGDPQRTLAHVAAGNGLPALPPAKVPVEVATLVSYLAARSPAERYPTAAEAADAIAACLGKPPVSGTLPPQEPWIVPKSGPAENAEEADVAAVALIDTGPAAGARAPGANPAKKPVLKKSRPAWLVPALGGLGLLAASLVGAFVLLGAPKKQTAPGDTSAATAKADAERAAAAGDAADGAGESVGDPNEPGAARPTSTTLVDAKGADGVPYEAPEPAGPPPRLRYLPPGSQLVLLARPAAALATDEGKLFVRSLGPRAAEALAMLARVSGVEPEMIEEIQAGWQAGGPDEVIGGVLVRGVDPLPPAVEEAARREALGATDAEEVDGETLYSGAAGTAWFPSDAEGRVLFLGPESLVREAVAAHRAADPEAVLEAVLPTDLEELVGMLDGGRHLTLFGSPDYLLHDGRPVLAGPLAKLVEPLGRFFGDSVRAAALSVHFGADAYLELDAVAPAGTSAGGLAKHLAASVATISESVEEYCNALDPHPYGRKLVMRLPRMLDVVADQLHSGAEGRGAIVNAWLPAHAPHNLALAAELALEQVPRAGGGTVAAATDGPAAGAAPKGAAEALAKPMSLVFAKDTLEKSIQMIADEIGVEMEILGSDLQLEGITKNQSFGLEERSKPAVEILRTILAKANPDGKLVYVIRSGPAGEKVEITTRAAVEKRGDTLPQGQDAPAGGEGSDAAEAGDNGDDQQEQEQR